MSPRKSSFFKSRQNLSDESSSQVQDLFSGLELSPHFIDEENSMFFDEELPVAFEAQGVQGVAEPDTLPVDLDVPRPVPSVQFSTDSTCHVSIYSHAPLDEKEIEARLFVSELPLVTAKVVDSEFEFECCSFHIHSTSTSHVNLSLGVIKRDFTDASTSVIIDQPCSSCSINEIDYLLSVVHSCPDKDNVVVGVTKFAVVSRRPVRVPLYHVDYQIVECLRMFENSVNRRDHMLSRTAPAEHSLPFYPKDWVMYNFPVVFGSGNFCIECGTDGSWVVICPHLFFSLYTKVCTNPTFPALYAFLYPRLWNHLHFSGSPPPFEFGSSYSRVVFAYAIRTLLPEGDCEYQLCDRWASSEVMSLSHTVPIVFEAQAGEVFLANARLLFAVIQDFFTGCVNTPLSFVSDMISSVRDYLFTSALGLGFAVIVHGIRKVVDSWLEKIVSVAKDIVVFIKSNSGLIDLFIKVIVRHLFDYTLEQQILELALVGLTVETVISCCDDKFVAQADVDPFVGVLSILFGSLVSALAIAPNNNAKSVSKLLGGAMLSIAAFDRAKLWDKLIALYDYLMGNVNAATLESLREGKTASAVEFYDFFLKVHGENCALSVDDKHILGALYHKYLVDAPHHTKEESQVLSNILRPAIEFVKGNSINRIQQYRRVPDVFAFHGPPGIGKSTIINHVLEQLCATCTSHTDTGKIVYDVNPGDPYASCYSQQDIWRFDEMFAEKDGDTGSTQSPFISYMYKLCTTAPQALNMAAVEDKGTYLRCSLVIGACNLPLQLKNSIQSVCKSVHDPNAVNGRVNYRVEPVLKNLYTIRNRRILKKDGSDPGIVHPRDLYEFRITDTDAVSFTRERLHLPKRNGLFTYDELLTLIISSYLASREFVPKSFESDVNCVTSQLIKERVNKLTYGSVNDYQVYDNLHFARKECEFVIDGRPFDVEEDAVVIVDPDEVEFQEDGKSECEAQGLFDYFYPRKSAQDVPCFEYFDIVNKTVLTDVLYEISEVPFADLNVSLEEFRLKPSMLKYASLVFKRQVGCVDFLPNSGPFLWVRRVSHITAPAICISALAVAMITFGVYRAKRIVRPAETECNWSNIDTLLCDDAVGEAAAQFNKNIKCKYYPQASTSPWLAIGNKRGHDFFLRISSQLFSLTKPTGDPICNAFALDSNTIMGPGHIFKHLTSFNLRGIDFAGNTVSKVVNVSDFTLLDETVGVDCALIRLSYPLSNVRSMNTLINRGGACTGSVVRVFRDSFGNLTTDTLTSTESIGKIVYSDNLSQMTLSYGDYRIGDGKTFRGLCGSIYLTLFANENESSRGGMLFGMHVAGRPKENKWVCSMIRRELVDANIVHKCQSPIRGDGTGPLSKSGVVTQRTTNNIPLISKARLGRIIAMPYDGKYCVSLLYPALSSGGLVTPTAKYLQALKRPPIKDLPDLSDSCTELVRRLLPRCPIVSDDEMTIESVIGGTDFTGSIDRSASPGTPFTEISHSKGGFCLSEIDVVLLSTDKKIEPSNSLIDLVNQHELNLISGKVSSAVGAVALKEEPRLRDKVLAGNTRVYTVVPLHENICLKRWFLGPLRMIAHGWRNYSGMDDFDAHGKTIHDEIVVKLTADAMNAFGENNFIIEVLAGDFANYDLSFTPQFMKYVSFVLRCLAKGSHMPLQYLHMFDSSSIRDKLRYLLLLRCSEFYSQSGFEMYEGVGHPSGSSLTCLLNYIGSFILFTYAFAMTPDILWYPLFLGDDSLIFVARRKDVPFNVSGWSARVRECGFQITNDSKTGDPELLPVFDPALNELSCYTFLSRHFTKNECVLSVERIERILPFQQRGKQREVIPECLDAVRRYCLPYHRDGLVHLIVNVIKQVAFCGFSDFEAFLLMDKYSIAEKFYSKYIENPDLFVPIIPSYNVNPKKLETGPSEIQFPEDCMEFEAQGDDGADESAFANAETIEEDGQCEENQNFLEEHIPVHELATPDRFGRPYIFDSFETGTTFSFISFPALTTYFHGQPYCRMGIFNKVFMRATVCMKVVASTSPFIYGRVMLGCCPGDYQPATLYEASGFRNVELDLSSATEVVLKFPMIIPSNWALIDELGSGDTYKYLFDYGRFFIVPMTSISASVRLTLFIWLEDVMLRGSTLSTWAIAEGGDKGKEKEKTKADKPKNMSYPSAEAITAASKARMAEKKQSWIMEHTPGWTAKTQAVVEGFGGMVECIESSIAGPLGDFLDKSDDAIKNIAPALPAMIGLSAPPCDTHLTPMVTMTGNQTAHMIGEVATVKMGASQNTRIVPPPRLFNSTEDEMDIYNVVKDFGLMEILDWDPISPAGTSLYHFRVNPGTVHADIPSVYPQIINPSRLAFVASLFRLWRGTIRYKFSIPKTSFQTGVLEFVYQSGIGGVAPIIDNNGALSRVVWDVSKQSTIIIDIPYNSLTAWSPVIMQAFSEDPIANSSSTTGSMTINVINPLVDSSGLVPGPVKILLYVAGGRDIEFARPGIDQQNVNYPTFNASKPGEEGVSHDTTITTTDTAHFEAQGGDLYQDLTVDSKHEIVTSHPSGIFAHLSTVGERVVNLRLLCKRMPYKVPFVYDDTFPGELTFDYLLFINQMMNAICHLYAFRTGGWRLSVIPNAAPSFPSYLSVHFNGKPSPFDPGYIFSVLDVTGPKVIDIPYTNIVPFKNLQYYSSNYPDPVSVKIANYTGASFLFFAFMCGADDFQLGYLTGAPAIILNSAWVENLF